MDISIEIRSISQRYRASTNEWCLFVNAWTDNVSLAINYTGKTLNKAKKRMLKSLPEDLLRAELEYRGNALLQMIDTEE